jgi:KaiC/GvpD/RAD55 family RecA-like ATPase
VATDAPTTPPLDRISTGVPELDEMLSGGLLPHRPYLLVGPPGSGKTTLALQFLIEGVRRGEEVLYVTLEEPPNEVRLNHPSMGPELDQVYVFDAVPDVMRYERTPFKDIASVREAIPFRKVPLTIRQTPEFESVEVTMTSLQPTLRQEVRRRHYKRMVIDSLTALQYFCMPGVNETQGAQTFLRFLSDLGVTSLLTLEVPAAVEESEEHLLARGEIRLFRWEADGKSQYAVGVEKFRGSAHDIHLHPYRMSSHGLDINLSVTISSGGAAAPAPSDQPEVLGVPPEEVAYEVRRSVLNLDQDIRDLTEVGLDVRPMHEGVRFVLTALTDHRYEEALLKLRETRAVADRMIDEYHMSELAAKPDSAAGVSTAMLPPPPPPSIPAPPPPTTLAPPPVPLPGVSGAYPPRFIAPAAGPGSPPSASAPLPPAPPAPALNIPPAPVAQPSSGLASPGLPAQSTAPPTAPAVPAPQGSPPVPSTLVHRFFRRTPKPSPPLAAGATRIQHAGAEPGSRPHRDRSLYPVANQPPNSPSNPTAPVPTPVVPPPVPASPSPTTDPTLSEPVPPLRPPPTSVPATPNPSPGGLTPAEPGPIRGLTQALGGMPSMPPPPPEGAPALEAALPPVPDPPVPPGVTAEPLSERRLPSLGTGSGADLRRSRRRTASPGARRRRSRDGDPPVAMLHDASVIAPPPPGSEPGLGAPTGPPKRMPRRRRKAPPVTGADAGSPPLSATPTPDQAPSPAPAAESASTAPAPTTSASPPAEG